MRDLRRIRPSPSMVVASIALLAALAGTSVAAVTALPNNSVGTAQLKANAVISSKVKNRSLLKTDFASGQLPRGPQGPQGPQGLAGPAGPAGPTTAWSEWAYPSSPANVVSAVGGEIARLTFTSPAAGSVVVTANYATRIRNTVGVDCRVQMQIAPAAGVPAQTARGFVDQWINGNLPTQNGAGTYLGLNSSATRVLPVVSGANTVYLNGKTDCPAVLLGPITMTAVLVQDNPSATLVIP